MRTKRSRNEMGRYQAYQADPSVDFESIDQNELNGELTQEQIRAREELEQGEMQPELKHLEKRWTQKGQSYITEPKDEDVIDEKVKWHEKFALCIIRQLDRQNRQIQATSLQVNSPSLKELLKTVIGTFPGQSFSTKNVSIAFEPKCLYHYRNELAEASKRFEPGSQDSQHGSLLLSFINDHFKDTIAESENLLDQGLINFDHLWTIFKPGIFVFCPGRGQGRVFELTSYQYIAQGCERFLQLNVNMVDYDGDDFGTRASALLVADFDGAQPVSDLNVFPLDFHKRAAKVEEELIARGRRWEAYAGQNFCEYSGLATGRCSRYNVQGRIIVDCKTFHRIEPNSAFSVNRFSGKSEQNGTFGDFEMDPTNLPHKSRSVLTDTQCLIATPTVRGFAFAEKKFLDFSIDNCSPIEWNDGCFDQLVLPSAQKDTVQALVAEHTNSSTSGTFDDIVKNKGRGLVLVLHGPPGVGKTLTAECVAEYAHRPLYTVSSGDLGIQSETLDERLSRILDLASTWKAVLLIDEADVFLERRSLHDLQRNSLVSIFLRTLEYYSGILFMTTNRVRTFDDAFKSRIHVPLKYEELSPASRKQLWKTFLSKVEGGVDVNESGYEQLSAGSLNGRQIKNVIRTAKSLAAHRKQRLDHQQLQQVMDIQIAFEKELVAAAASGQVDVVEG